MISVIVLDYKVLRMAIQFDFFPQRSQNGECNVRIFRRFFFNGMSPDVPSFKVRVFINTLKFWIGVNEY